MAGAQHHTSKKLRYDLVFVPRDDAGQSKSVRLAPWQMVLLLGGAVIVVAVAVTILLVYTPVGTFITIENPGLVNRYSKELISLNERMTNLMVQLVELREYNVKLRTALGEHVVATDTGVTAVGSPRGEKAQSAKRAEPQQEVLDSPSPGTQRLASGTGMTEALPRENHRVVFPVVLPCEGYITRGFEPAQRHYGLDIAGSTGSPVHAAADGYVVFAGWGSDDGNNIILSHPGGFLTFYKHNQSLLTTVGAYVRRGEPIALLGSSGETSAGPHVHFEIWKDGVPVDPANFILNLNF